MLRVALGHLPLDSIDMFTGVGQDSQWQRRSGSQSVEVDHNECLAGRGVDEFGKLIEKIGDAKRRRELVLDYILKYT